MAEFGNKVALVTGAATPVGEAVVEKLYGLNATVLVAGPNLDDASGLATRFDPTGDRVVAVRVDPSDASGVEAVIGDTLRRWGALHFAVDVADGSGAPRLLEHVLPAIAQSGGGSFVHVGTGTGDGATPDAVRALVRRGLALAGPSVRVNALGPSGSGTSAGRVATREQIAELVAFLLSDRAPFLTGGFWPTDGGPAC